VSSIEQTDCESAAVATAPRVSLADIEAAIAERHDMTGARAADIAVVIRKDGKPGHPLSLLSICILVMKNGFTVIGKSAPASAENFNPDLGKKFAYEDAIRQLWPLMGFALRDRLAAG
jgi:Phage protein (N4 Gp49/phage Sf6 gene 66) family